MDAANVPAFQVEDYMPPENEIEIPSGLHLQQGNIVEKDPAKYWKPIAKKQNDKVENFVNKKKAMEQAVAQTVAPDDPQELKLRRFTPSAAIAKSNYEKEKSEQEQKREKQKAVGNVEELIKRGYGTGDQITWLFLAMARAAGFDASPVMVSRRNDLFFNPGVMNERELNDNVVQVKVNGKEHYFDPGTAFTPYG